MATTDTTTTDITPLTAAPTSTNLDATTAQGLIQSVEAPTATPRTITTQETVAGQLQSLISQDSPYIQSARNSGMETANSRGLVNSSIAAGTSERAAIDAAAPIAAQDASTYAASGLSAQTANQSTALTGYQAQLKTVSDAQALYNSAELQEQQGNITKEVQAQKDTAYASLQTSLKLLDVNVDLQKIASSDRSAYVAAISPIMQQYQSALSNLQMQPDSVLTWADKRQFINYLAEVYKPQLESISNIYGYAVDWGPQI